MKDYSTSWFKNQFNSAIFFRIFVFLHFQKTIPAIRSYRLFQAASVMLAELRPYSITVGTYKSDCFGATISIISPVCGLKLSRSKLNPFLISSVYGLRLISFFAFS